MSIILGLCYAAGALLIFSYFKYPDSTFPITKNLVFSRPAKRSSQLAELWPDVVDDLASAIRAGLSLPQAMILISESGPIEVQDTFRVAMQRYQTTGDFVGSLEILGQLLKDPVADKFVSAIQIAYEVGGTDLGHLLRTLSEVIREENKVRGEIQARQSWTINGARLAIGAPWFTVLILSSKRSTASIYLSASGLRLLVFCALISGIAYFAMSKIGALPVAKRIRL